MYRILVVEDDADLKNIFAVFLGNHGYLYDLAASSAEALAFAEATDYDLVLLDVMLPDENGDVICMKLRQRKNMPIVFVSCLDDESTIINALRVGGDDYVVKPFQPAQLLARIEANIRRYTEYKRKQQERNGINSTVLKSFSLNHQNHSVLRNGHTTTLSPTEYSTLILFMENPDRLLLYNEIYHNIWQRDSLGDFRTVMVHVSNLRKKLEDERGIIIKTVRGAGYIFSDE